VAEIEKKSFIIYENWARLFTELTDEDAGALIKAICNYKIGQESHIENKTINAIFSMMQTSLDIDNERYMKKVERIQKINESKRNRNEIVNDNETKSKRNRDEIVGVNDNVNDNVNVNVNENVNVYNRIFDSYNSQSNLIGCKALTKTRLDKLKSLLEIFPEKEIIETIEKANDTPWLIGKNKSNWKADFDWLMDEDNFCKVMDGRYDNMQIKEEKQDIKKGIYDFDSLMREERERNIKKYGV